MWTTDRVGGATLVLVALLVLWESRRLPLGTWHMPGPAYLPVVLAIVLVGLAVSVVATGGGAPGIATVGWTEAPRAALVLGVCAFATWGLERLGYRLTMFVALAFLVKVAERRGWLLAAAFAAGMAEGSFYLFSTLLRVPLPRGPFGL